MRSSQNTWSRLRRSERLELFSADGHDHDVRTPRAGTPRVPLGVLSMNRDALAFLQLAGLQA
jgi:hypothetical protein